MSRLLGMFASIVMVSAFSAGCTSAGTTAASSPSSEAVAPVVASQQAVTPLVLRGSILIKGNDKMVPAGTQSNGMFSCQGRDGFEDVAGGAPVIVSDQSGTILAKTALEPALDSGEWPMKQCELPFAVEVPAGLPFYQVAIGSRAPYVASAQEAQSGLFLSIQ